MEPSLRELLGEVSAAFPDASLGPPEVTAARFRRAAGASFSASFRFRLGSVAAAVSPGVAPSLLGISLKQ
jgi:hypothetical protein